MSKRSGHENYQKKLYDVPQHNDDIGILSYGNAWPLVKRLAEIERQLPRAENPLGLHDEKAALERTLSSEYPDVAKQFGLHSAGGLGFKPVETAAEPFTHFEDYRSVRLRGETYSLTSRQAQMIKILHGAYESGNPDVGIEYILEQLGTRNSRWQDTFKRNPNAKIALIRIGERKGTLRLNL